MNISALKIALKAEEGEKPSWPKVRSIIQSNIKPLYWNLLQAAKDKDMAASISNLKKLVEELDLLAKYLDLQTLKRKFKQVEKLPTFSPK